MEVAVAYLFLWVGVASPHSLGVGGVFTSTPERVELSSSPFFGVMTTIGVAKKQILSARNVQSERKTKIK